MGTYTVCNSGTPELVLIQGFSQFWLSGAVHVLFFHKSVLPILTAYWLISRNSTRYPINSRVTPHIQRRNRDQKVIIR